MNAHYQWADDDVLILHCIIQPKAAKDEIVGLQAERLKIRLTAPPADGKANKHLIGLLSKWFGTAKSKITVERGETGRQKTLRIANPTKLPDAALITPS